MILLLDNYDSFVHNLARYLRRLGCETKVVRSDEVDAETCLRWEPSGIVLSPGPKGPQDTGCCIEVVRQATLKLPILGVCLGHQTIAAAYGGTVGQCGPMHGMSSQLTHVGQGIFRGLPSPMRVGRYHSLAVLSEDFPSCLRVTASAEDGTIMGIEHREYPVFGVQFHPESVLTEQGTSLLRNFVSLCGNMSIEPREAGCDPNDRQQAIALKNRKAGM